MEMIDREKVINGLECCLANGHNNCPYESTDEGIDKVTSCTTYLMRDALALLKAQQPRVMTLDEWISAQEPADGECMCYEIKGRGLRSMLVKALDGTRYLYGKAFRVWTVRPTDAQRKAVKWDDT